jgi:hypothetical protein
VPTVVWLRPKRGKARPKNKHVKHGDQSCVPSRDGCKQDGYCRRDLSTQNHNNEHRREPGFGKGEKECVGGRQQPTPLLSSSDGGCHGLVNFRKSSVNRRARWTRATARAYRRGNAAGGSVASM